MTVENLAETLALTPICLPEPDREVTGGYAGDLLSWVMGRAKSGDAWLTIMTNQNILAVATLADTACVIIAEDSEIGEDLAGLAEKKGVNLLKSGKSVFDLAVRLGTLLDKQV